MRKVFLGFCSIVLFFSVWSFPVAAQESQVEDLLSIAQQAGYPATEAMLPKASIVVDADSGQLLWGDNIDLIRDPASTTKTMVVYLTMEAISQGKITLDTEVLATEADQAVSRLYAISNNKIIAGVHYTVRELLTMTLVPSSNVATLMLSHLIHDGDDASFLQLMNDTARELGMTNTTFYNMSGAVAVAFDGYYAPAGYDWTATNEVTAKDLAILTAQLIKKHPEILEYTNQAVATVRVGTPLEENFATYNYSLPGARYGVDGVDGLKTGSSPSAGFNAIVTVKRGDTRLICVVLGTGDWSDQNGEYYRHYFINSLVEKTFSEYTRQVVATVGEHEINGQKVRIDTDLYALVKNGETPELIVEGDRLKVANSVFSDSGIPANIVAEPAKNAGVTEQDDSTVRKQASDLLSQIPIELYFLVLGLMILIVIAIVSSRSSRKNRRKSIRPAEENATYSRRRRRRR